MRKRITDIVFLIVGNFLLAYSVSQFILPCSILSGGLAGIAILFHPFTSIPESTIITILAVILFLLGSLFLGKKFAMDTAVSTVLYPIFLFLLQKYVPVIPVDRALGAIYGGIVSGAGIGLVMRTGGSTGGMDIPPLIAQKYLHVDVSSAVIVTDTLTVLFGLWIYGLADVLIGLASVYITGKAINWVITFGSQASLSVQIISEHYEEIYMALLKELERGVTLFDAEGGYTHQPKKVILIVVDHRQYHRLLSIAETIDPNAFLITSETREVHGEGFTYGSRI
ncbi:MAG: YitT family protein [Erysipelotrichaceae bacterium]|nr:YitT family protein [Erysipelotrichaceae bacterium]